MPCYTPLTAYYSEKFSPETGKRQITFRRQEAYSRNPEVLKLPCGRCIGCRLEYSRQWALRSMFEASLYQDNSFITLTYSDDHLPKDGHLIKKDFQDFMKRLRMAIISRYRKDRKGNSVFVQHQYPIGHKIKYLHCGEYGSLNKRPHFHAILFNCDFYDKKPCLELSKTNQFSSDLLTSVWSKGFASIGNVTFDSCAYVARYCMKKVDETGHVEKNDLKTSSEFNSDGLVKEYMTASRKNPLGYEYFNKFYYSDIGHSDTVILKGGIKCKPPKYFDHLLSLTNEDLLCKFKSKRKDMARNNIHNQGQRLSQRGKCAFERIKQLKRGDL